MSTPRDTTTAAEACERVGLRVIGPVCDGLGMDGGVVVACAFTDRRLDALDELRWRTCPTGREHTIVVPRASA